MPSEHQLEFRLIQFGVIGYVLSLPVCAVVVLSTYDLTVPRVLALFWGVVAMGYGVSLMMRRQGLVPARGGMRMMSPRGAAVFGAVYLLFGCALAGLSWFLSFVTL